jgi:3-oxoacyl-[acyl-carrier protein] reductase
MPSVVFSEMMLQRYESEEQMMDHYVPQMPIRRIGYPEDIAKVVLFLSSNLSDYVCGEVIVADGGKLSVG